MTESSRIGQVPGSFDYPPASNTTHHLTNSSIHLFGRAIMPQRRNRSQARIDQERGRSSLSQQSRDRIDMTIANRIQQLRSESSTQPSIRTQSRSPSSGSSTEIPRNRRVRRGSPARRNRMRDILMSIGFEGNTEQEDHSTSNTTQQSQISTFVDPTRPRSMNLSRLNDIQSSIRLGRMSFGNDVRDLEEAGARLAQMNEDLRVLEQFTMSQPGAERPSRARPQRRSSARRPREEWDDAGAEGRRKRRRLNAAEPQPQAKTYGYYGRVVSGPLSMVVVEGDSQELAPATTILGHDGRWRSQGQQGNLTLAHEGLTTFSIEEIVLTVPGCGDNVRVQRGLVFTTMKRDAVFDRTAKYRIINFPTCHFARYYQSRRIGCMRPLENQSFGNSAQNTSRSGPSVSMELLGRDGISTYLVPEFSTDEDYLHHLRYGPLGDGSTAASSCDEGESSEVYMDPYAFLHRYQGYDEAESESRSPAHQAAVMDTYRHLDRLEHQYFDVTTAFNHSQAGTLRGERIPALEDTRLSEASPGHDGNDRNLSNHLDVISSNLDLLQPAAQFSVPVGSSYTNSVSIKFNPPISARYLLLKLWCNKQDGRDTILQRIDLHGFAGPRSFPSFEIR